MKDFRFRKIWFSPVLILVFALASLTSCQKDEDGTPAAKSLDVTVYISESIEVLPGDVLQVVVFNSDVTEMDPQQDDIEPDVDVSLVLTQDMIDNGVTVNLDTIDLDEPLMYIGAFVDLNEDEEPSPGDLVEFYQDVDFLDAFYNDVVPVNCHGLSNVEIDLDQRFSLPKLDVTVNFTGDTQPTADDALHIALFYSNLSGSNFETISADDEVIHNLTPNDVGAGSVTVTLHNILPWENEVYIGAFVDTNGNEEPDMGELIEMYQDKDIVLVLDGTVDATNVYGETAITMDLDNTITE